MSSKTIKMPRRRCESYKKRNNAALFFKSLFCEQIFYIIFLIKYCFIDQENYCNADKYTHIKQNFHLKRSTYKPI